MFLIHKIEHLFNNNYEGKSKYLEACTDVYCPAQCWWSYRHTGCSMRPCQNKEVHRMMECSLHVRYASFNLKHLYDDKCLIHYRFMRNCIYQPYQKSGWYMTIENQYVLRSSSRKLLFCSQNVVFCTIEGPQNCVRNLLNAEDRGLMGTCGVLHWSLWIYAFYKTWDASRTCGSVCQC